MENCTSLQNYWLRSDHRLQDYKSNENIPFPLLVYMNKNPLGVFDSSKTITTQHAEAFTIEKVQILPNRKHPFYT